MAALGEPTTKWPIKKKFFSTAPSEVEELAEFMEHLVEEVERVAESGSDQPAAAVPVAGPWEDHPPSLVASWSTWPGIHGPACAGKLLGGGWPCAGTALELS